MSEDLGLAVRFRYCWSGVEVSPVVPEREEKDKGKGLTSPQPTGEDSVGLSSNGKKTNEE